MSGLISRQSLLDSFDENNLFLPEVVEKLINAQPTAYNVDKVVEQFKDMRVDTEKCRFKCRNYDWSVGCCDGSCEEYFRDRAIEIVKAGGVND